MKRRRATYEIVFKSMEFKEERLQKVGWMDLGRRFPGVRAYAAYDIPLVFRITWLPQVVFRKIKTKWKLFLQILNLFPCLDREFVLVYIFS